MSKPNMKLSVITINYNNHEGLKKTMSSVLSQAFKDFEYLIIDGNSTDGSKELLQQHNDNIDFWVSEPDKGIYDAMNKGIARAKGAYCMFLNSGDFLLDETILQTVFSNNPTEDILYGDLKSDFREYRYPQDITLNTFFTGTIPHQASFIKTELFTKYGNYDESYPIIADWVFFVKAIMVHHVSYRHLDMFISFFEHGGVSTQQKYMDRMNRDRSDLFLQLFPRIFPDYLQMSSEIDLQKKELSSYRNSRLIQWVRSLQKKILRTR